MARIRKEQKIIFANAFYLTQDGKKALELAGLPNDLDTLQKLLTDKSLAKYLENYGEFIEILEGRTKDAHINKLESLFDIECQRKKSLQAVRLSERIEKLKGWDKEDIDRSNITIDLQLGTDTAEGEEEQERTSKVERYLKLDGVLNVKEDKQEK